MADRDRYQLRGPVQSVQSEFASVDPETGGWEAFRQGPTIVFDRDGRHDHPGRGENTILSTTVDERRPVARRADS